MKALLPLIVLLIALSWCSCNVINPAEKLPTYIQMDSVKLISTLPNKHGSVHHKITDVWVYYNRNIIGPFELPCRVPIQAEGRGEIQVLAGIYENGLSATRVKYPFYTVDTFSFDASPTQIIKHTPIFNYRTTDTPAITYMIEDFEQGNIFVKRFNNDTTMTRTNTPGEVFEEDWSGVIRFKDTINDAECITSQTYLIPPFRDAFMELSYKSDVAFDIATEIFYKNTYINSTIISVKSSNDWKKIYLKLGGFADTFQGGSFKFIIRANKPNSLSVANIFVDNFKIIYFN